MLTTSERVNTVEIAHEPDEDPVCDLLFVLEVVIHRRGRDPGRISQVADGGLFVALAVEQLRRVIEYQLRDSGTTIQGALAGHLEGSFR
jgi:hypothetical protein